MSGYPGSLHHLYQHHEQQGARVSSLLHDDVNVGASTTSSPSGEEHLLPVVHPSLRQGGSSGSSSDSWSERDRERAQHAATSAVPQPDLIDRPRSANHHDWENTPIQTGGQIQQGQRAQSVNMKARSLGMSNVAAAAQRQFVMQASGGALPPQSPSVWPPSDPCAQPRELSLTAPPSPDPRYSHISSVDTTAVDSASHQGSGSHVHHAGGLARGSSGAVTPQQHHVPTSASSSLANPSPISPSGGFNGATAREFFRSHLRAIAFTARLSHMAGVGGGAESPEHGGAGAVGPGEMSEQEFERMAQALGREESLVTLRSMYQSLQQFRTLLVESRTMAGSELQKEETFNRIVTRVRSVVQAEAVVLLMLDRQTETFYSCATTTTATSGPIAYQHSLTHSFGGHVLRYKTSLNLKYAAEKDPRFDPDLARKLGGVRFRSVLAVPVFNKNGAITAVIVCVNKRNSSKSKEQFFSDQDQSLVEFIALLAGHTIENAQLYSDAVTRRNQTETLLQINELLASELDTPKVMQRMVEAAYLLVNAEKITLFLIDPEKEELVSQPRIGWADKQQASSSSSAGGLGQGASSPPAPTVLRFPMSQGILGFVATSGKPVNCMDARKDWRFDPEVDSPPDCATISLLVVPVTDHMSRPIAVIQAVNRVPVQTTLNPITGGSQQQQQQAHSSQGHPHQHRAQAQPRAPSSHVGSNGLEFGGNTTVATGGAPGTYFTHDEQALLQSMAVSAGILLRKSRLYDAAVSTRKKTEALLQISELMSADLDSSKIMAKIVQAGYMLVSCECILLYMVDEGASELVCEVGKDGSKGSRIPLGHGVAGHTALTGRSLNITDAATDWRFDASEHSHFKNKVQTILAIPIKDYLGKNVGVIALINKRSPSSASVVAFSSEDEDVLNSLAYTAGAVLRKSRLYDEAISRRRQTEALLTVNEIMSAELSAEKIMQRIIEASYLLVECERITLFAVDSKTGELVCQVSKDPFFQGVRMAYGHGIVGHVALTRRSLNIVDAYSDVRFNQLSDLKTGYKTHSILTVPVTDRKGQAVAVIQAVNKRGDRSRSFTPEDVLLLESMAVNAGMLLQKSRLFDAAVVADRKSRALVSLVMTATREDQSTEWIMHEIGRVAYDALAADRVYIFFVDQIQEMLTCVVGPDEEGWTIPLGRGIAGWVALTGELVNVEDAFKHGKFDPLVDVRGSYKPKSILCMGVKNNDGEVIAVVYAVNKRSAAQHAQMQWSNVNVHSASAGSFSQPSGSGSHGGVLASPLRPQGPPPSSHATLSTPPAHNVNPYSSNLPPTTAPLRKHSSRSSLINGSASPWHSLRPFPQAHDDGRGGATSSGSESGGMGRISPMSSLPSPMRHRGSGIGSDDASPLAGGAHPLSMYQHQSDADTSIEVFTAEDEDILRALCAEVRSLLIRHVRETVLEMNQLSMNDSVYSYMDMLTGVVSSRTAVAAAAANAANHTHQTTSGLPAGPGHKGHVASMRPTVGGANRHTKRTFKAAPAEHLAWPIGTSRFSDLLSLDFNVWCYSPDDLLCFSYEIFASCGLIDEFQIVPEMLKGFFLTVRSNYHDNPFHNWYHGFSVLHFSFLAVRTLTNASDYLTQHDVLALMVASLCHDIDHPGNTNSFEINTGSELALIHNDLSVLENHHAYVTFRILRSANSAILGNLRKDTFQSLKKMVIGAILATDMLQHFSECRNLDKLDASAPFSIQVPSDRQVLVNTLIHSADLSAQCFPTSVARVWEERITREFESQAAREKAQGIPVADFMLNLTNPLLRRQNQVNFIVAVLVPWWRAMVRLFPGFKMCYKNLLINQNYYDANADSIAPSPEAMSSTVNEPESASFQMQLDQLHQQQQEAEEAEQDSAVSHEHHQHEHGDGGEHKDASDEEAHTEGEETFHDEQQDDDEDHRD